MNASALPSLPIVSAPWRDLAGQYLPRVRAALTQSILPFWWRTIDERHGGVFNCWNNAGTRLISRDKFTWSQGRFAWLWSRLARVTTQGLLPGEAHGFRAQAGKTVQFLREHALLEDGRCAYLLSEDGAQKEAFPGAGLAPSIYADCFAMMGFAEYGGVAGERDALDIAWRLLDSIERRVAAGGFPSHPYPIPSDHEAYAIAMIHLNLTLVMHDACRQAQDGRQDEAAARVAKAATRVVRDFLQPDGRIVEFLSAAPDAGTTLLTRHLTPGHSLEGLWMLFEAARLLGRPEWIPRGLESVCQAFERGWDETHGGLFLYVDSAGGSPTGAAGTAAYETHVRSSWDTKLWWVHSEALYASALAYRLTGDERARGWFERAWAYALRVFPNPDTAVGEWIQIRDRQGRPLERVVALPVKDPYHIARNLIQLVELFAQAPENPADA